MKEIIRWLESKLFRSKPVNPPIEPDSTNPDRTVLDLPKDMQDLVNDAPPVDNVEYEDDVTLPDLRPHDQPSSDADEPTGIDPYNTAKLHKK